MADLIICNADEMARLLEELGRKILAAHPARQDLALIGIRRRGADLARRLGLLLESGDMSVPVGSLDINLYRDDWTRIKEGAPQVGISDMGPGMVDNRTVVLVDDVLFSGRTIRAALEAILDYGRPARIELLVLVDRGHRELPIQPDYTGIVLETRKNQHVEVLLAELDGEDALILRQAD